MARRNAPPAGGIARVFDAVIERASIALPWILKMSPTGCAMADADHEKSWRQFAHTGCKKNKVCFARAAETELTREEMIGMVAHELGHVVGDELQLPEHSKPWKGTKTPQAVQDEADAAALRFFGIAVRYNARSIQEATL